MSFRTCDHPKQDGVFCGSPALRGKKLCTSTNAITNAANTPPASSATPTSSAPRLPRMKSLADVQIALYKVLTALADRNTVGLTPFAEDVGLSPLEPGGPPSFVPKGAKKGEH